MKKKEKPTLKLIDYVVWGFYKLINKYHYKNNMGIIAGWWQAGNLDRIAWEWLYNNHKPDKYWITVEYKVKYYRQIEKIKDLVYGTNNLEFSKNTKGNRLANFDLEIWQNNELMTVVNFTFVEKKHIKGKKYDYKGTILYR